MAIVKDAGAYARRRSPDHVLALVHGPDQGLVRERAAAIGAQVAPDADDPWAVTELSEADLSEAGRLADEAQAMSFGGGDRLIRLRGHGPAVLAAVKLLLAGVADASVRPAAFTVVEAGELKKTAGLRKACEASPHAGAIACYADDARAVAETVRAALSDEGLTIEDDALAAFAGRLGEDRGITRSEIDKLILYAGPKTVRPGPCTVTLDDVNACLADSTADATFEVWDRAAGGDAKGLSEALFRAEGAGANLLGILRISQNKLWRLLKAAKMVEGGQPASAAMKALRPPVFYGEQPAFQRQLKAWDARRLEAAAADLLAADLAAKRTGAPQREVVERALLSVASRARRG